MIRTRTKLRHVALGVGCALALVATPVATPSAQAATASPALSLTVGTDGRVYQAPFGGSPSLASSAPIGPPGAGVTAVWQLDGTPGVLAIGQNGGLVAAASSPAVGGLLVSPVGPSGIAPPGAHLDTVVTASGVHAFFVGSSGAVYQASFPGSIRSGAVSVGPVTPAGTAPPGAFIAAAVQTDSAAGAAFVGTDGALHSVWQTSAGTWVSVDASPPGVATPGGGVAATSTTSVNTFFTGLDGQLWQVQFTAGPLPDPWEPVAISATGAAPAGAALAAAPFIGGALIVLFAGANGAIEATTNAAGAWQEPSPATPGGVARPGGAVSLATDDDGVDGNWCGNGRWWSIKIPIPRGPYPEPWNASLFPVPAPVQIGFNVATLSF